MIPPAVAKECRSPGERLLFDRLRDDPGTRGWIVLHSLGIAKHPVRQFGEIDLVVLAPGYGVLCVEVKSGPVERRDGRWFYGGHSPTTSDIGPFRQASDAMHAMREFISKRNPELGRLLYYSSVVFTSTSTITPQPLEWHDWQLLQRNDFIRRPISSALIEVFQKAHRHVAGANSSAWYDDTKSRPTQAQVELLASILRPDFEFVVDPFSATADIDAEIRRFTAEQFRVLDLTSQCTRVLVQGPAGTGKTFLALEAARRSVLSGRRVLLACYNRLLGHWLAAAMSKAGVPCKLPHACGTLASVLQPLSNLQPPAQATETQLRHFYTNSVPSAVIDRILSGELQAPFFDQLILDEAQDLLGPTQLDVLDLLLTGGISAGCWMMFGDFEKQAIYRFGKQETNGDLLEPLYSRTSHISPISLRENCRNTREIAAGIELAAGLNPKYSNVLCQLPGEDVKVQFYGTAEEEAQKLLHLLGDYQKIMPSEDIIVLSPRRADKSCAHSLSIHKPLLPLRHLDQFPPQPGCIHYSSIHSFKGLESAAIIVTDIDNVRGALAESLLYVALSRARVKVTLLVDERCREDYMRMLDRGLLATGRAGALA